MSRVIRRSRGIGRRGIVCMCFIRLGGMILRRLRGRFWGVSGREGRLRFRIHSAGIEGRVGVDEGSGWSERGRMRYRVLSQGCRGCHQFRRVYEQGHSLFIFSLLLKRCAWRVARLGRPRLVFRSNFAEGKMPWDTLT